MKNFRPFSSATRLLFCAICLALLSSSPASAQSADDYLKQAEKAELWSKKRFDLYMKAAELGNAEAQCEVGFRYAASNRGVAEDYNEAFKWYKKSADQGYVEAIYYLGEAYMNGRGVQQDDKMAEKYLLSAAYKEYDMAYFMLGLLYKYNLENKNEAIYWFKKDVDYTYAERGEPNLTSLKCLEELGVYYFPEGKGSYNTDIEKNNQKLKKLTDNISWGITKDGTLIIAGTGEMPTLKEYPWAKKNEKISVIHIGNGITSISGNAFYNFSALRKIVIPKSLKRIEEYAFFYLENEHRLVYITDLEAWCNIDFGHIGGNPLSNNGYLYLNNNLVSNLVIPSGVEKINKDAFAACNSISSVSIPTSVIVIGEGAFGYCKNLRNVNISNGVLAIGQCAFENSAIESVILPSTLESIGESVFRNNRIAQLEIPEGVTSIGNNAFSDNQIAKLTLPSSLKNLGESAFMSNNITQLEIPEGVTSIGNNAFSDNQIAKLTLPSSLKNLGESAFRNNKPLSSLVIANGITKISKYAFSSCSNLSSVNIPNSVTVIAEQAFSHCKISKLILPNSVKTIEKCAFYNSFNRYSKLSINNSVQSIGKNAFANENGAFNGTIINLPSWLNVEKSFVVGISKESYRAYRPSASDMSDKGRKYYDDENYKTALDYFLKGTQGENPSGSYNYVASCYLYAGWCYEKLNDYNNAIIMHEKAEELGDKNASSSLKRCREKLANQTIIAKANAEYSKGNYELAFQYYEQAYKENKTDDNLKNINKVPEYYKNKHDYNNALKYYKRIYSIRSADDVKSNLVLCYEKLGNINGAIDVYKPQAEKGNKECQYKIAQLYEKTKNKNLAIFWYKKAAEQKHLRAEEALAKYGIYINTQNSNSNSNSNNNDHNHQQQQQVYTSEYGVRDVWVNCFDCHGTGKCSYCNGTGWCISTNGHGEYNSTYKCTICHGSGRCTYCYGSGGHYEKQQYQIR